MANSEQKIALITGGNRGIGFAIAQGLISAGWQVIIGARSIEKGKAAVEKLNSDSASTVVIDVADDNSIQQAAQQLSKEIPHLNVLINNAGIYPDKGGSILTIDRDLLTKTLSTNTFSQVLTTQAFLPLLKQAQSAKIINYSSGYGQLAGLSAGAPSYCLSKLGVNGVTIMLAEALSNTNIAVCAVDPGWVSSDMGGASAPRTLEQGADTAVWLAEQETLKENGRLWRDRTIVSF